MVVQKLALSSAFLALITFLTPGIPSSASADEVFCEAYMHSVKRNSSGRPTCSDAGVPTAEYIGDSPENSFFCWSNPIDFECYDKTEAAHSEKLGALEIYTSCFYSLTGPTEAFVEITAAKACKISYKKIAPVLID